MQYIKFLLICVFLLFALSQSNANEVSKKVLFLHSYDIDDEETYQIDMSARKILSKSPAISITTAFLNTQNIDYKYNYSLIKQTLATKFQNSKFDIILISKDDALDFYLLNRNEIFSNSPAVFCGVNKFNPENLTDYDRITGIIETLSVRTTLSLIQSIHQNKDLYIIGDQRSASYKFYKYKIEKFIIDANNLNTKLHFIGNKSINELITYLNFNPNVPLILISPLYTEQGETIPKKLSINILNNKVKNPIYSFWESDVKFGAIGGKVISGEMQGKLAANYIISILSGKSFIELPVITKSDSNIFEFNYFSMLKHNITRNKIPKGSKILFDKENNLIKISKTKLMKYSATGISFLLLLFLLCLKFKIKNIDT